MTEKFTTFRKIHCILTACRLERRWKRFVRIKKRNSGQASSKLERKLQIEKAKIDCLTQLYSILTKGADHPERLSI
ncbi:MAG: hypothetical protein ACOX6P_00940 [Candidatus Merdivicinus sp.]|jgi:hypothetical protein